MKNKLFAFIICTALCFCLFVPVCAASADTDFVPVERTLSLVEDYADVLTKSQEKELEEALEAFGLANELEVAIVTIDSFEGYDPQAFADDFYDYNGYGYGENDDGFILVYNTGKLDSNRNVTISTHGKAISLLDDSDIDTILSFTLLHLKEGEYEDAFYTFIDSSEGSIAEHKPSYIRYIPISVLIAFVIAFIIVKIQASGLKTVRQKVNASDYVGNVVLTDQRDNFLYRNVRKSPKPKNNGSSTHRSSSGRSHGGGSRSF